LTNTRTAEITTILFDAGNTLAYVDLERVGGIFADAGAPQAADRLAEGERAARAVMYRSAEEDPAIRDRDRWEIYMAAMFREIGLSDPATARRVHDTLLEVHRRENLWRHVPDGTVPALHDLRERGYRLGVVSNADGRVPALLREIALADFFEAIVDSHLVGVEKPDPRIFAIALEEMGADPRETMYVGDFPSVDVAGAEAAGLLPVLLDPLGIHPDASCLVVRSLGELGAVLPPRPAA